MRRIFILALSAVALILSINVSAQNYVAGKDYRVLATPIKTSDKQVEMLEFFWYGCGHCYNFEPVLTRYAKSMPAGSVLKKAPAVWRPVMKEHGKIYFALKAMDAPEYVHMAVFKAILDRKPLNNIDQAAAFVEKLGLDGATFRKNYSSFGVDSEMRLAIANAKNAQITGTPELLIAGKYVVGGTAGQTHEDMLKIADFLIKRELKARHQ